MQQAEEAAAEAEAERDGIFRLEVKGAVVEPQFFERIAQEAVLMGFDGVKTRKDHGFERFKSGQRLRCGIGDVDDRVADLRVGNGLNIRKKEPNLARRKFIA